MKKYDDALKYEIFEKKEYSFLDDFIKNSKTIIDIGAHYGYFSLYSLEINKNLNIYALEPIFYKKAIKNLIEYNNVKVYKLWVATKVGEYHIYINSKKTMQSSIYHNNFLNKSEEKVKCEFITIKKFIKRNNIESIDLMKIDIEWAEFDVLLAMENEEFSNIQTLCLEYHILDNTFQKKFNILVEKLRKIYTNIKIIKSEYTDKIGYILASNRL